MFEHLGVVDRLGIQIIHCPHPSLQVLMLDQQPSTFDKKIGAFLKSARDKANNSRQDFRWTAAIVRKVERTNPCVQNWCFGELDQRLDLLCSEDFLF